MDYQPDLGCYYLLLLWLQLLDNVLEFGSDLLTALIENDSISDPLTTYALPDGIRTPSAKRGHSVWNVSNGHLSETASECSEGELN